MQPLEEAAGYVCIGAGETPVAWIARARLEVGAHVEVDPERCLVLAPESDPNDVIEALQSWPARRLLGSAELEIGSRLLVIGDGPLAARVLALAGRCEWRAGEAGGEHRIPAPESGARLLATLPARPDAVIVTAGDAAAVNVATEVCGNRGVVVAAGAGPERGRLGFYPHVHRRGLRLVLVDAAGHDRGAWAALRSALARRGLVAQARLGVRDVAPT